MYRASLLPLHFWNTSQDTREKASQELGLILVQHTCVPERDFGQTKLYQVTKDEALAPPQSDTLDLVWAVTFTSPSALHSSSALYI